MNTERYGSWIKMNLGAFDGGCGWRNTAPAPNIWHQRCARKLSELRRYRANRFRQVSGEGDGESEASLKSIIRKGDTRTADFYSNPYGQTRAAILAMRAIAIPRSYTVRFGHANAMKRRVFARYLPLTNMLRLRWYEFPRNYPICVRLTLRFDWIPKKTNQLKLKQTADLSAKINLCSLISLYFQLTFEHDFRVIFFSVCFVLEIRQVHEFTQVHACDRFVFFFCL